MKNWVFIILALGVLFLWGLPAYAACSNPAGVATDIVYNKDALVMQYCDGTDWIGMHAPGTALTGPTGCPNIGDTCDDGSVYAGLSPDGGVPMYTTPSDAPSLHPWNDGSSTLSNTSMTNCTDGSPGTAATCQTGEANTAFLVGATGEPSYPFAAAEYCDGLSAHGYNDWYLPAQDELNVLFMNKSAGDLNGTFNASGNWPDGYYWSSSESNNLFARSQLFSTGDQYSFNFNYDLSVRCVRKASTITGCTNPTRDEGAIVYNADYAVLQVCAGTVWRALGPVPGAGGAGCSNPTKGPGQLAFNDDYGVMQYCDGTNWVAIGKEPPAPVDPCAATPAVGTQCADNSYYIGDIGAGKVYATTSTHESSELWNNGTSNWTTTGYTSTTDGAGNTAGLVALSDAGAPYDAAVYCDGLSAHGHSDWYLPAQDELNLFYNGGSPVAGIDASGTLYWSSTEYNNTSALVQWFSDGLQFATSKPTYYAVRCVRR